MSPSDVAGVFSRYFIVGFFLPSFFALVGLSQTVTTSLLPGSYEELAGGTQVAVLGGLGLLLGLLMLGLNWQIFRLFEGYPLVERKGRWGLTLLYRWSVSRQKRVFDRLVAIRDDSAQGDGARGGAAWKLDREFPLSIGDLMPTRFGNAVLAFETHAMKRWGLDSIAVWPRIDMLLSDREGEQQANARSEAAFFVNGSVLAGTAGLILIGNQIADCSLSGWALLLYVIPFLIAALMARWAAGAAIRWGSSVRSAIDLHRFELYEKLGVRLPRNFTDERENVAEQVNQALVYGNAISDQYFQAPKSGDSEKEEKDA
jgi:hypothetical protein